MSSPNCIAPGGHNTAAASDPAAYRHAWQRAIQPGGSLRKAPPSEATEVGARLLTYQSQGSGLDDWYADIAEGGRLRAIRPTGDSVVEKRLISYALGRGGPPLDDWYADIARGGRLQSRPTAKSEVGERVRRYRNPSDYGFDWAAELSALKKRAPVTG